MIRRKISEWIFTLDGQVPTYASINFLVTRRLGSITSAGMVLRGTSTAALQHCCLPLTSPVVSPLFLMKKWQVRVISLGMCPTTVKQLFRCKAMAYLSCSLSPTTHQCKDSICACTCDGCTHCISLRTGYSGWRLYLVPLPCSLSLSFSWLFFVLNQWDLDRHWLHFLSVTLDRHWWTYTL